MTIGSILVTFHFQALRTDVSHIDQTSMLNKISIMNILSPHLSTLICNTLTLKYFIVSEYRPTFVTVIENSCIHFIAIIISAILII